MKHILILALIATGISSPLVVAADPVSDNQSLTMSTQSAGPTWAGAYVSGNLSYASTSAFYCDGFDGDEYDCNAPDESLMPEPQPSGAIIGISAGYDWQSGRYVYGVAGDLMFASLSDVVPSTPAYGCDAGCGLDVNRIAMLRGRLGYDMGKFLPYVTAGLAVTRASASPPGYPSVDGTYRNTVLGLGTDYRINDKTSAGFEVFHLLQGDDPIINDAFCGDCGPTAFSATLARVTLSYRY